MDKQEEHAYGRGWVKLDPNSARAKELEQKHGAAIANIIAVKKVIDEYELKQKEKKAKDMEKMKQ